MHGLSVALYWDPSLANNGFQYKNDKHKPSFLSDRLVADPPTNQAELPATVHNVDTLLKDYATVFTYSSPRDFILHLYQLGKAFSYDPSKADSTLFLHNPVLIVMNPFNTPEHCAIVRFTSYLAFGFPSVTAVMIDGQTSKHSFASCGVYNFLPQKFDNDSVHTLKAQSQSLTDTIAGNQKQSPFLIKPVSNVPYSDNNSAHNEQHLISFQKSQQHVQYFLSSLELFHKSYISKTNQLLLDSGSTSFKESDYPLIFNVTPDQITAVLNSIGHWDFYAHDFNYDQLLFAAFAMFKHGLSVPEVDELRIDDMSLYKFLLVIRDSYRPSNPYHNFRHAVDVLQATFFFLLRLHSLPSVSDEPQAADIDTTTVLSPVEALTILIVAIGHDIGHPGVTNLFLVKSHSPIATVFNNRSVLESFHSAAFTEILGRYWACAQDVPICRLIVQSVLATDMALHFDYMEEVSTIIDSPPAATSKEADGLGSKTLICCLLIKCADISNVARTLPISSQWGIVLGNEFAEVEVLEIALGLRPAGEKPMFTNILRSAHTSDETVGVHRTLVDLPPDNLVKLAKGQIFFINTFAKPLFYAVSKLLPQLRYTLSVLEENAATWAGKLAHESSSNEVAQK